MDRLKLAVRAAIEDVRCHGVVIGVSVALALLTRWTAWALIPLLLIAGAIAGRRHGWRIVIDRTHIKGSKGL